MDRKTSQRANDPNEGPALRCTRGPPPVSPRPCGGCQGCSAGRTGFLRSSDCRAFMNLFPLVHNVGYLGRPRATDPRRKPEGASQPAERSSGRRGCGGSAEPHMDPKKKGVRPEESTEAMNCPTRSAWTIPDVANSGRITLLPPARRGPCSSNEGTGGRKKSQVLTCVRNCLARWPRLRALHTASHPKPTGCCENAALTVPICQRNT